MLYVPSPHDPLVTTTSLSLTSEVPKPPSRNPKSGFPKTKGEKCEKRRRRALGRPYFIKIRRTLSLRVEETEETLGCEPPRQRWL
jgi:hypothetical protein